MKHKKMYLNNGLRSIILSISFMFAFYTLSAQGTDEQEIKEKKISYPTAKPAGFFQQQFTVDNIEDSPARFIIYRARLGFKGFLSEKIKYNFIIGAVEPPDRTPALVNGFIDFTIHPLFNIRTGQFLVPFGLEGPEPIFLNPAIERAVPTRKLNTYSMFRDIGINMYGSYSFVSYSLSVLNGKGANATESINPKDVALRVNLKLAEHFIAGLSGQVGTYETDSLDQFSRQRWGVHTEYYDEDRDFHFRGEFILLDKQIDTDAEEISMGGYLLFGYKFSKKLESILRLEYYQPDNENETYSGLTLGANYLFSKRTRLSLNGTTFSNSDNYNDFEYMLNIQLQFVL